MDAVVCTQLKNVDRFMKRDIVHQHRTSTKRPATKHSRHELHERQLVYRTLDDLAGKDTLFADRNDATNLVTRRRP